MTEFDVLQTAAAGMDAQRAALDVAARNVAASQVTGGRSFERLVPHFSFAPDFADPDQAEDPDGASDVQAVRFVGAFPERGSSADPIVEMVAALDAQRAFESDASIFDAGKRLAERTIELGRT